MDGHNRNVGPLTELTLSAAPRRNRNAELVRLGRCGHALPAGSRRHARWCSNACRQRAYRRGPVGPAPLGSVDERAQNPESDPRARRARRTATPVALRPAGAHVVASPHDHSPRLCAVCMAARALELRRAPRARVNAELVARRIRADGGDIWGAVVDFGISYTRALEIRRGDRGAGRQVPPLPYQSRGYTDGRRNGWSTLEAEPELEVIAGGVSNTA